MSRKQNHNHSHNQAPHPQNPQQTQHSHRPLHDNRNGRGNFPKPNRTGQTGNPKDEGIADMLTTQLSNVMRAADARLFIFGSRFDDGARFSSFDLAIGIHDIHMNQGSSGGHAGSNGIYQDGALLAFYPAEQRWSAVFLKFASQSEQTDDRGNAVG